MKSWHIVVMNGYKVVEDIQKFSVQESREIFEEKKKQSNPTYSVKREYY
jgi:hypothetical protein